MSVNSLVAGVTQVAAQVKEVQAVEHVKDEVNTGVNVAESLLGTALGQDPQAMAAVKGLGDMLKGVVTHSADVVEAGITGQSGVSAPPVPVVAIAKAANALGI